MNKKHNFVQSTKLEKISNQSHYIAVLGERSNGKSFAVKELILKKCYEEGCEFTYLRRFELDIKDSVSIHYYGDTPVSAITNGEYTTIDVYRKTIYFANINEETGKVVRGQKIGYCHALSGAEHLKSLSFPKVKYIDFEELVSMDGNYLFDEPNKLQHYVSTIFRHRTDGKVFLVGNTISRICPYYREWGLEQGMKKQKLGEVKLYKIDETVIAVYLTDSLNYNSGMFFGNIANNITKGMYETKTLPHLPKPYFRYKSIYQFVLQYNEFKFYCELLQDVQNGSNITWYVQPKTTEIQKKTRVVSNKFDINPWWKTSFKDLSPTEKEVMKLLFDEQVCYSDNLTGTEFLNILKYFK